MIDLGATPRGAGRSAVPSDGGTVLTMAAATGLAVANQYYNQPMLGLIGRDFGAGAEVSMVATATQLGYALGIVLLVPLGDRMDRRRLILLQCIGLLAAMALASYAPSLRSLTLASVLVGVFSTIAQQIVSFAAELADPKRRGKVVGTVLSGLLCGVLLARTASGFVGEHLGWRAMFQLGACIAAVMAAVLAARLPRSRPEARDSYVGLLLTLLHIVRDQRGLRRATMTQGLLFAGFSAFWTILALFLQGPAFGLGGDVAGLFGVLAVGGVLIAPYAGGLADRQGPEGVVLLGVSLVALAFILMAALANFVGLVVGVVLLDAGLQLAMVGNQTIIFAAAGPARGRFNTVFMTGIFGFGALGSTTASLAWSFGGWSSVMALGAVSAVLALLVQLSGRQARPGQPA